MRVAAPKYPRSANRSGGATTLVIGLGNPILGDDGVGWRVVEQLERGLSTKNHVELECLAVGGLSLMERMLGYPRVILVDAISTGLAPNGTVRVFPLAELEQTDVGHTASAHDTSLGTALRAAAAMGADIPERVEVVAVEAETGLDFTEELTPPVAAAVQAACDSVIKLLE